MFQWFVCSNRGHEEAVLCVQFDQKKIVSGSADRTIKVVFSVFKLKSYS